MSPEPLRFSADNLLRRSRLAAGQGSGFDSYFEGKVFRCMI